MYKTRFCAALLLLLLSSCSFLPWRGERVNEVNLAFNYDAHVISIPATMNGREGTFLFASALPRSIVSQQWSKLRQSMIRRALVVFGDRATIHISPEVQPLPEVANGLFGIDTWRGTAVTIDYRKQLLSVELVEPSTKDMTIVPFTQVPRIPVTVNGQTVNAVVDTTLAGGLVLPSATGRAATTASVAVAGTTLPPVPVVYRNITEARVGNDVLEHFLVTLNYRRHTVALWRDPRA